MSDDKPVDLKQFKRRRAISAYDKVREGIDAKTWQGLRTLWQGYADGVANAPEVPDFDYGRRSDNPRAVFSVLLGELVSLAQAFEVDDNDIIDTLLLAALTQCEPEGRLHELIDRAWNLLDSGDEEASEKLNAIGDALKALTAQGMTTEEAIAALKAQHDEQVKS